MVHVPYSTCGNLYCYGGNKNSRYVDVVIFDNNGQISEIHQVGRTNKSGTPVSREVKAMNDIKNAPQYNGAPIYFHPYDR